MCSSLKIAMRECLEISMSLFFSVSSLFVEPCSCMSSRLSQAVCMSSQVKSNKLIVHSTRKVDNVDKERRLDFHVENENEKYVEYSQERKRDTQMILNFSIWWRQGRAEYFEIQNNRHEVINGRSIRRKKEGKDMQWHWMIYCEVAARVAQLM